MSEQRRRLLAGVVIGTVVALLVIGSLLWRDHAMARAFAEQQAVKASADAKAWWPLIERVDNSLFDWFAARAADREAGRRSDRCSAVVVDAASLEFVGKQWPWNRSTWQPILSFLRRGKPRAVLFDLMFPLPDLQDAPDPGRRGIEYPPGGGQFVGVGDMKFAMAIAAQGRVYLNYHFSPSASVDDAAVAFLGSVRPTVPVSGAASLVRVQEGRVSMPPFPALRAGARGTGWIDAEADPDFTLRRTALLVAHPRVTGLLFPSLALAAVLQEEPRLLGVSSEGTLVHQGHPLPRDASGSYLIRWRGRLLESYPHYPAALLLRNEQALGQGTYDALADDERIDPAEFADRYVVIGTTTAGGTDLKVTPVGTEEPGMVKHLAVVEGLLAGRFVRRATTATVAGSVLLLCLASGVLYQFLRSPLRSTLVFLALLLVWVGAAAELFARCDYQLDMAAPGGGLILVFGASMVWNYFVEDRSRRLVRSMFQKYMSPELVAKLIENPELIRTGGDRRVLTAFFSDLANFTSLSEQLEPEELVVLINEYLGLMTDDIIRCGGFLDKYQGDGIMAVFGVYPGQGGHALDACRAALDNQRNLAALRARWEAEGKPRVAVRIGVNTGPMVAGNVGSEAKLNYTVLGDAVNLASRLESANKQFGTYIMIAESTYEAAREQLMVRELDLLAVKGKKKGVRVFELLGIKGEHLLSDAQYRMLEAYEAGLASYRARRFAEALAHFERGLQHVADDGPCRTYVDRCTLYMEQPPDEDWDGVFHMKTK